MSTTWSAAPPAGGAALPLQQNFSDERVKELDIHKQKFLREITTRRTLAYILKGIAIFGGIIVAAKIPWINMTVLGITIAAAVGIDQLTSNHARLISVAAARHACDRLRAKIVSQHTEALPALLVLRDSKNPEESAKFEPAFSTLMSDLLKEVHAGQELILEAVREADLKALRNLYVDEKKP